jgi:hypothetical protein
VPAGGIFIIKNKIEKFASTQTTFVKEKFIAIFFSCIIGSDIASV